MLQIAELVAQFQSDPDRVYKPLVGFEYEVFLFDRETLSPLRYGGPRGLGAVLQATARWTGGKVVEAEWPNKVDLPWGALISLEPGGQFEFSSAPVGTFGECLEQIEFFMRLIEALTDAFDLHPFFGGATPVHQPEDIGLVIDNERYGIMNAYFPTVGQLGRRMMRQTTSVQVTFDYRTQPLGVELLRASLFLAPIACAIFANSPFIDGKPTGYRSYRGKIWQDTDPSRCGLPPGFARPDYSFADYVQFVLDAPMFFVDGPDGLKAGDGMTFGQFNREGLGGHFPAVEDFLLHNSTIFTDARLKQTVEVRSVDGQDPELMPAVLAFLSGLLLCNTVRPRTLATLEALKVEDHNALALKLSKEGLSGQVAGRSTRELALELLDSAAEGLATCYPDGAVAVGYLDPIRELVEAGKTPADVVMERHANAASWLSAGRVFNGSLDLPLNASYTVDRDVDVESVDVGALDEPALGCRALP